MLSRTLKLPLGIESLR